MSRTSYSALSSTGVMLTMVIPVLAVNAPVKLIFLPFRLPMSALSITSFWAVSLIAWETWLHCVVSL